MFKKGNPGGPGRPKKLYSRSTECKFVIESFLGKTIPQRLMEIAKANPRMEVDILTTLLPFCYPKLGSVDITAHMDGPKETSEEIKKVAHELKEMKHLKDSFEVSDADFKAIEIEKIP